MNEADVKRAMVLSIKTMGGYARRLEDQYAVGVFDTLLIPKGLPVFAAEVKIIRAQTFGPTPRQWIELQRVMTAADKAGHVIPVVIGYKDGNYYFHQPQEKIQRESCFSVTTSDMSFHDQLVKYYYYLRGTS